MPLSAPIPKTAFFAAINCCCCVVNFANAFSFFLLFSIRNVFYEIKSHYLFQCPK